MFSSSFLGSGRSVADHSYRRHIQHQWGYRAVLADGNLIHADGMAEVESKVEVAGGMTINQGTFVSRGGIDVAESGSLNLLDGEYQVAAISVAGATLGNVPFNFAGGTLQVGTFEGELLNQGGTLAPGPAIGTTTINGELSQQAAATLRMEVGGTQPAITHDRMDVLGAAFLDGQLELALTHDFLPEASDIFELMEARTINGTFANAISGGRLDTVDGGGSFLVNYGTGSSFDANLLVLSDFLSNQMLIGDFNNDQLLDATDIDILSAAVVGTDLAFDLTQDGLVNNIDREVWVLELKMSLFGDADFDGLVEFADFLTLSASFGGQAGWAGGDFDGDGDVAFADFLLLSGNFGSEAPARTAAVPEPSSLSVFLIGLVSFALIRRTRRSKTQ